MKRIHAMILSGFLILFGVFLVCVGILWHNAQRKAQVEAEAQKAEQSTKTIVIDDTIEHGTVFLHYRTNNGEEIVESYAGTVEVQPGENGPVYHVYTDQEEMEE